MAGESAPPGLPLGSRFWRLGLSGGMNADSTPRQFAGAPVEFGGTTPPVSARGSARLEPTFVQNRFT